MPHVMTSGPFEFIVMPATTYILIDGFLKLGVPLAEEPAPQRNALRNPVWRRSECRNRIAKSGGMMIVARPRFLR